MGTKSKKNGVLALFVAAALTLSACGGAGGTSGASGAAEPEQEPEATAAETPAAAEEAPAETAAEKPKVAFAYLGVPGDGGWTYQHDQGVKYLEETLGIDVTVVENVPDGPDAERVFTELAMEHDIVFGTSFGYMDAMYNVAQKFPDVIFLHCSGYKTLPNMGTYLGNEWETHYLAGIAAGSMTKNDKLGYVGAYPIPEVIYSLNAFALGVQSVSPEATVDVVWSNTWYDPATERQAAVSLLDQGIDVLAAYQDSPASLQAAAERGVFGIGNDSDMGRYAPDYYITNNVWNWGPYYVEAVQSIMDGTWESGSYMGDMKGGMVQLAPFGKNVPQEVQDLVEAKKQAILDGSLHVFTGPIYDQAGNLKLGEGETMTLEDILAQNWLIKGVNGTVPQ